MSYQDRFNEMKGYAIKGAEISLIISIVLMFALLKSFDIASLVGFEIIFTPIVSIILSARSGEGIGYLGGAAVNIVSGLVHLCFGGFVLSPIYLVVGFFKLLLGVIVLIPVCAYLVVNFIVNFIYFGIMFILENKGQLEGKEETCMNIDKIVNGVVLAIVLAIVIMCVKAMSSI